MKHLFHFIADFESYFRITQDGNVFNIITTGLPSHVLNKQRLLLTIIAMKPRTVGAQAVLYIAMPEGDRNVSIYLFTFLNARKVKRHEMERKPHF